MGVYEQLDKAMEEKNAKHYLDALHEEYEFIRHQTGTSMEKGQTSDMMTQMMANENVVIRNSRCIYENEDILVEHSVMDFPDGSTEAVMAVHTISDGKIIRTETGATLLSS